MPTLLVERDTETIIDYKLKNLGYQDYPHAPDRNVFKQSVKTPEQKRKLQGQKPDYTLYPHNSSEPFGIIEAKKVGQNMRGSKLIYCYFTTLGLLKRIRITGILMLRMMVIP